MYSILSNTEEKNTVVCLLAYRMTHTNLSLVSGESNAFPGSLTMHGMILVGWMMIAHITVVVTLHQWTVVSEVEWKNGQAGHHKIFLA